MQKKDLGLGVTALGFGAWMFYVATTLKGEASFWPRIVAGGIMILGAAILLTALFALKTQSTPAGQGETKKSAKASPQYLKVLAVVLVLIAFYFGFQYLSYTISTFLLICLTAIILGYRNWKVMIPTALIVSIGLYLAFTKLFGIHFPGIFF